METAVRSVPVRAVIRLERRRERLSWRGRGFYSPTVIKEEGHGSESEPYDVRDGRPWDRRYKIQRGLLSSDLVRRHRQHRRRFGARMIEVCW